MIITVIDNVEVEIWHLHQINTQKTQNSTNKPKIKTIELQSINKWKELPAKSESNSVYVSMVVKWMQKRKHLLTKKINQFYWNYKKYTIHLII